ncbi:MAG TPA: protease pro-enzyme activation domain-containing protein [Candidatus Dormibacteraeota bacterium]|nr:protease pro-enzyme activation domain-containing protein [Candidatus Dormibacteraeota bacterium]
MTKRTILRSITIAAAAALLSACHGGGAGGALPMAQGAGGGMQTYHGPATLAVAWNQQILQSKATYLGPATVAGNITLNVQPQLRNAPGLLAYARSTGDPHSGNYRHWLTPQQIGMMYGASGAAIATAGKYFAGYHLSTGTWPQHLTMVVSGTQANVEAAFGTKFGYWQLQTSVGPIKVLGPAPDAPPHFASALPVVSVMNMVGFHPAHTYIERPAGVAGAGYSAPLLRNAFDYAHLINNGYRGQGINVGIIGTGPISPDDVPAYALASGTNLYASVVQKNVIAQPANAQNNGTGTGTFDPYPGGLQTPPPVTGPCGNQYVADPSATCNPEDGEAQLDTEQQAGLAPGATVDFYLAYNTQDCVYYGCAAGSTGVEGIYLTDDEIQQVIADDVVDTLSLSFGLGEPYAECNAGCYFDASGNGPGPDEMAALAAEGVTVFVSSGDNGAYQCDNGGYPATSQCASYPATDPSAIAVGGVNAPFTNSGQLQPGEQITAWGENTTWGGDGYFDNSPGSGGGPSLFFPAPSWQSAAPIGATMRETPDISLLADPNTGPMMLMYADYIPGYFFASGGTSAAAPEMAAMFADFLSACKANSTCAHAHGSGTYGYRWGIAAAPALYAIAQGESGYGTQAACAGGTSGSIYDVCAGSNGTNSNGTVYTGFQTGPGYDMVTGVGVPFGARMAQALFTYCSCGTLNLP